MINLLFYTHRSDVNCKLVIYHLEINHDIYILKKCLSSCEYYIVRIPASHLIVHDLTASLLAELSRCDWSKWEEAQNS